MSRWYIIHAYSGFENKVRDAIHSEANRLGLAQLVEAVEVPTEKVTEVRRGKKVTSDRKFFPGYVLAKLNMSDDVYHLIKNTPKVTGFLGTNGKPQPISEAEAARILNTKDEAAAAAPKTKISVSKARLQASTASSKNSISTAAESRLECRFSDAQRRSSWNSSRWNE
jgi:transcriptional antiterminator NusG